MHDTALQIGSKFLELYSGPNTRIVTELGSMDVNGSLRSSCLESTLYLGLDQEHGNGVDFVVNPRTVLPIRSAFSDLTLSTSQMEHDPFFWKTFLELCRITKPGGVLYLSAPSNGNYHAYPVDVWRFYPDAGKALVDWALDNGHDVTLIESFIAKRKSDKWNDFVALFFIGPIPRGMQFEFLSDFFESNNIWKIGSSSLERVSYETEDQLLVASLQARISTLEDQLQQYKPSQAVRSVDEGHD